MEDPTCVVPDCSRKRRSARSRHCEAHYYRLRRSGSLDLKPRPVRGACTVDECGRIAATIGGMCGMHAQRVKKHGDPTVVLYVKGEVADAHPSWRGADITYSGAHSRVRAARGAARGPRCVDCDAPAKHWSYSHDDPNELVSDEGPYSADVEHYAPRCVSCHKTFDLLVTH